MNAFHQHKSPSFVSSTTLAYQKVTSKWAFDVKLQQQKKAVIHFSNLYVINYKMYEGSPIRLSLTTKYVNSNSTAYQVNLQINQFQMSTDYKWHKILFFNNFSYINHQQAKNIFFKKRLDQFTRLLLLRGLGRVGCTQPTPHMQRGHFHVSNSWPLHHNGATLPLS